MSVSDFIFAGKNASKGLRYGLEHFSCNLLLTLCGYILVTTMLCNLYPRDAQQLQTKVPNICSWRISSTNRARLFTFGWSGNS
eukprot:1628119-Amphidinium_carterae.1